jgi:hypothetical protein
MTTPASKNTVKDALTPHQPPRQGRRSGRTGRPAVENSDYSAFLRRAIRSAGKRVGGGDVDGLADLLSLAGELDRAIDAAVRGLREAGYSWGEIASRLGVTRQAAQQRWGGDSRRLPNGEPCAYAHRYGLEDWHEHDHTECQEADR